MDISAPIWFKIEDRRRIMCYVVMQVLDVDVVIVS